MSKNDMATGLWNSIKKDSAAWGEFFKPGVQKARKDIVEEMEYIAAMPEASKEVVFALKTQRPNISSSALRSFTRLDTAKSGLLGSGIGAAYGGVEGAISEAGSQDNDSPKKRLGGILGAAAKGAAKGAAIGIAAKGVLGIAKEQGTLAEWGKDELWYTRSIWQIRNRLQAEGRMKM